MFHKFLLNHIFDTMENKLRSEKQTVTVYNTVYERKGAGLTSLDGWVETHVRSDKHQADIEKMRELRKKGQDEHADAIKRKLPAVVPAGDCMEGRTVDLLRSRSGFAMFDGDHWPVERLEELKRKVMDACPWVHSAHITSSGEGLRFFVRMGVVVLPKFEHAYTLVAQRLAEVTGLPDNVHYLCNSSVIIDGVKLYGMPMFMEDLADGSYDRNIRAIPEDTDVLITHQPPYKILDFSENRHYGDKGIWKRVMEVVPRFHLFGHIHNAYNMYTFKQVAFSNASLVDNDYELCREPRLLEVTEK